MQETIEMPPFLNTQEDIDLGITLFIEKFLHEPDNVESLIQLIQTHGITILNSHIWNEAFTQQRAPMKRWFSAYTYFLWISLVLGSFSTTLILLYMSFIQNAYYFLPAAVLSLVIVLDLYLIFNKAEMKNWFAKTWEATPSQFVLKMTKLIEHNIPVTIDISQCTFLEREDVLTLYEAIVRNQTAIQPVIMRFKDIQNCTNALIMTNKDYQQAFIVWRTAQLLFPKDIASGVFNPVLNSLYPFQEYKTRLKVLELRKLEVFFNEHCENNFSIEAIQVHELGKALLNRRSEKQSSGQILDAWEQKQEPLWLTGHTFFKGNPAEVMNHLENELKKPLCRYADF